MQTFLPHEDFRASARVLDRQRLGKQRVEVKQILAALDKTSGGWVNHPAVKMWRGHRSALAYYGVVICQEWRARGYNDSLLDEFVAVLNSGPAVWSIPKWVGDVEFHRSHQSNLVRKFPEHYGPLFPGVSDDLPYVWPEAS